MARRPEVFVRPLSIEEGRRLQRITRTAKDPVKLRRAIVVMMSAQGQSVPDITSLMQVTDDYVRGVVHAFNERGFEALDPKWSGGRPPTISQDTRERICLIARTVPAEWGITGMSTWSLKTLATHLAEKEVVASISREHLRRILRKAGVTRQTTTTWKSSNDPDFIAKHAEVRAWAADNQVELVFLPTYGSWLNWIESEFAALRYFALNGTDHRSHADQNAAIAGYVRHHNKQARPKTNFAQSSPIRSWTSYPAKAA